jgi:hypothetical protein
MAIDRTVLRDSSGRSLRRPVVYLDHSTLVDAFFGKRGERADAALNAEIAAVVEDVARRGTLCLSPTHVIELIPFPRRDDALAMAAWLDGLDPAWFQMEGAAEDELTREVMRRVGLKSGPAPGLPVHHAMTAAMRENLRAVARDEVHDLLSAPDVASLIRKVHGNPKLTDNAKNNGAQSIALFRRTHDDRASVPEGTPPERVREVTGMKLRVQLQIDARQAISSTALPIGEDYPTDTEISRAVLEALDDPDAIPMTKVGYHLQGNVADVITRQEATSKGFQDRFRSFVWDTRHALAAAVVDVFTCDAFVDSVMTDFRTSRGMERQISLHGRDRAALVAELRRQCT